MQDCSTFQSEDLGLGIEYLMNQGRVWLMNSWQIVVLKRPRLGDQITVGTWAYDFKSMYGYRNFIINDKDGNRCVNANSVWVYMDLMTNRPVKVTEHEIRGYQMEPKIDMEYADRKIILQGEGKECPSFPVRRYHIDTNHHVNNGQYIMMANEFIPENIKVREMRAEYRQSAVLGDIITPYYFENDGKHIVSLCNSNGKPYAIVEFVE